MNDLTLKEKLRSIVDGNSTRAGRIFDVVIQVLIVVSVITFSIDTLPNLDERWHQIFQYLDFIIFAVFAIEYVLRIYVAEKRLAYIFSFYGFIDFIAILPFLLGTRMDLRSVRAFRALRILSALKIVRYNKAFHRFHLAFKIIREEMVLFLVVSSIFIFIAATGIFYFENEAQPEAFASIFHALWWAIVTLNNCGIWRRLSYHRWWSRFYFFHLTHWYWYSHHSCGVNGLGID